MMVKEGTPRQIVDTLMAAIEKMKQIKDWQDFSRLNMQSSAEISLDDMQKQVRAGSCRRPRFFGNDRSDAK